MENKSIVIWKDGSYLLVNSNSCWEYENDKDWLVTIDLKDLTTLPQLK